VVFFLNGLYTHVRSYPTMAKLERFTIVVLLSLTVFITVNYLVILHQNPIGRSVSLRLREQLYWAWLESALLRNGSSAKGEPARSAGPPIWTGLSTRNCGAGTSGAV